MNTVEKITPTPSARLDIKAIEFNRFERIAMMNLCHEKVVECIKKGDYLGQHDWVELEEKFRAV